MKYKVQTIRWDSKGQPGNEEILVNGEISSRQSIPQCENTEVELLWMGGPSYQWNTKRRNGRKY